MGKTMHSERLTLRDMEADDLIDYHQLIFADEEVCRYYAGETSSLEKSQESLTYRILEAKYADFQRWAIVRKEDGQFMGILAL